ncbi:phosphatase PAP2 family protein [Streptomyces sp. 12297]
MRPATTVLWRTASGCAAAALVLTVLLVAQWPPLLRFDRWLAAALHRHAVAHPAVTRLNRVLSDWVWDPWTMRTLAALAAGWLLWRGDRRRALCVAVATVVASAVQHGLKVLLGRERPTWPDPVDSAWFAAFPSGHAMTAAVVCGLLLWVVGRPGRTGWAVAAVSVLGVGWTRLYLGVHWFSDVLGGWLLGVALAAGTIAWCTRTRPEPPHSPGTAHRGS